MLGEYSSGTPSDVDIVFRSKCEGQDREGELVEPNRPPVDVVLGVVQEIHGLPHIAGQSNSFSDRSKFLDVLDENEGGQRGQVYVKQEHFNREPCHHLTVADNFWAFFEIDSALNLDNENEENNHLGHQEHVAHDFDVVEVEGLVEPVKNQSSSMGYHSIIHELVLVTVDKGPTFSTSGALSIRLKKLTFILGSQE